jgi:hypothetical protein
MPNDDDYFQPLARAAEADNAFESSWWLMGGALTLLVWTGLVMLLTGA